MAVAMPFRVAGAIIIPLLFQSAVAACFQLFQRHASQLIFHENYERFVLLQRVLFCLLPIIGYVWIARRLPVLQKTLVAVVYFPLMYAALIYVSLMTAGVGFGNWL